MYSRAPCAACTVYCPRHHCSHFWHIQCSCWSNHLLDHAGDIARSSRRMRRVRSLVLNRTPCRLVFKGLIVWQLHSQERLCSAYCTRAISTAPVPPDRYSYERTAIADWYRSHDTSPMTNEPLESKYLVPNRALLAAIRVFYS